MRTRARRCRPNESHKRWRSPLAAPPQLGRIVFPRYLGVKDTSNCRCEVGAGADIEDGFVGIKHPIGPSRPTAQHLPGTVLGEGHVAPSGHLRSLLRGRVFVSEVMGVDDIRFR